MPLTQKEFGELYNLTEGNFGSGAVDRGRSFLIM